MEFERLYADIMLKLKDGLSPNLYYHGVHHTLDVMAALTQIGKAEGVSGNDLTLLKTAALLHDSGFLVQYNDHELAGCEITRGMLPKYGYTNEQTEAVCDMIMATKIPQNAKTQMQQILCDADLDYLGRNDFYPISKTLFQELKGQGKVENENEWNKIQVRFLTAHSYFTETCRTLREPEKQKRIEEIKKTIV